MEFIKKFGLFLILLLATILRFWDLANNPPGLTWDEAALGYNAYSLYQTGGDEYGSVLPLNLKSFGDWKPALYAYLDIPFIALLGLNELAVRLPSAVFGILGVLGIFLLTQELLKNRWIALLSAFFLAISPWHLQFSRPAFEVNVALTFNIFAVYFFLKGLEKQKFFLPSALLFGLSLLTYQASKLFVPLLIFSLLFVFKKEIKLQDLKFPTGIFAIFIIIMGWIFLNGQTGRLSTQNFFAYQRSEVIINQISLEDGLWQNSLGFKVLHGEWWAYTRGLIERYLIYFSPKMLFVDGDYSERHRVPDLGALYYFSVVLVPLGLVYLLRSGSQGPRLILLWFLISPLPAVFSRDLISILRALNMVIPYIILEGIGFWVICRWIRNFKGYWGYFLIVLMSLLIFGNFLIYVDRYFIHAPKEYSKYWLYGYREAVQTLNDLKSQKKYSNITMSDTYGQPYIYYLFYNKYPPRDFQKQVILDQPTVDVGTVRRIDDIEFRHVYWPHDRGGENSLFIGTLEELPDKDILPFKEYKILKDINFLNGEKAFRFVETE